ncbi:MAG: ATP-binding protein [Prevotella sp.]|nr:ATP-binding protein [Prevotella sp.]MCI6510205.1 ATP-binding protein [Prevotella sp.]MCI6804722.1 ATP-binding protein [Prevotella sp.]MCI7497036.1 ATP-binding protein [Prevotella sp.]MDD6993604.1 ATP-binding protein [Prevotella sp.]
MKRKIYSKLIEWKESPSHKPLILNGVRQCGKTYIMKEFGKNEFQTFAYVNCDRNENLHQIFEGGFNISKIIRGISALSGVDIIPGKTLIFLDEVQSFPLVLESLKYFCEDAPDYHVAVAGSLLGIALHSGVSFPVGKVQTMKLYPMDFEEFLMAKGEQQLLRIMHDHDFDLLTALHEKCKDLLRQYYYVGGMPEVVKSYIDNGQLKPVRAIQNEILSNYAGDFSKHAPYQEVPRISMVWQSILGQLSRENKKFIYGALKKGGRAKEFEVAIQWLVDAGLVYKVNKCTKPQLPLKFYEDFTAFKLYLCDCGLMGAMADTAAKDVLIGDSVFTEYKGAFTEQYVLQQILSSGISDIYYYSADDSRMEMDFLMQREGALLPVEVKGGTSIKSTSLHNYLMEHPGIQAIRYSMLPYKKQDFLTNIPLYAVGI